MNRFVDDNYQHIENELEQIQKCPGMYISSKGTEGAFHLLKEIAGNSFDEANNICSPCDRVDIYIDEGSQHMIVEDNGRGIPFSEMVNVLTKKHTSTKYERAHNRYSAGCFGVGLKVANAFSHILSVESFREGQSKLVKFIDCKLEDYEPKPIKGDKHGLVINCYPSTDMLGPVHVTEDMCIEWLRRMSYIMSENLTVGFYAMEGDCEKIKYSRQYTCEGIDANVKYLSKNLETEPIMVKWTESDDWKDFDPNDSKSKELADGCLKLSVAFSYDKNVEDELNDSYCNGVWTYDGGVHLNMCRSVLCDYMVRAARKLEPDSKYPIIAADVRKGLVMVVNCDWERAILSGQHKSSVASKEIEEIGRKGFSRVIAEYFDSNGDILKKLITYYRQMAKIRLAASMMKGIKPPKPMTMYEESEIAGYYPLADSNKKGYRELFITEGDSASGAIVQIINPKFQAVYHTQGPLKNTLKMTPAQVMKSTRPRDMARILEIEPGKPFDINNFKWNKLIYTQDADADGMNIRSLTALYHMIHFPQLVEEGRLYAAMPPLYDFNESTIKKYGLKKSYLCNKKEFNLLYNNIVASSIRFWIIDEKGNPIQRSKTETISFFDMNKHYYKSLELLAGREACDYHIIEHVCNAIVLYGLGTTDMVEYLKIALPEMYYNPDEKSLVGSYYGKSYGLIVNNSFMAVAKDFLNIFTQNQSMYVMYVNKNKSSDDVPEKVTIGDFFKNIYHDFDITAKQRFKGLGEAEAMLLFETTVNPKTRRLIRLTMEDREKAIKTMELLHGDDALAKRDLLESAEIDEDDIDN